MGVHRFEDLVAWQLAFELQQGVFEFTAYGPAWHDVKFREQIRDASASATRNIAEGFGRFRSREFARFLYIARGSLMETRSHLHDAHARSYLDDAQRARLLTLSNRALGATTALLQYLTNGSRSRGQKGQRSRRSGRDGGDGTKGQGGEP